MLVRAGYAAGDIGRGVFFSDHGECGELRLPPFVRDGLMRREDLSGVNRGPMRESVPRYDELPRLPRSEERHAWDVWGRDDEVGTLNFIGSDEVREACRSVTNGQVVPLSLPLDEPSPGLSESRQQYVHRVVAGSHGRDDSIDGLYLQFSSQWDGLRHVRYREHGFYGGRQDESVDKGGQLGIEHWARRGIISRGVLLDIKGEFDRRGRVLAPDQKYSITADDLNMVATAEGVRIGQGDVVMIRTGWLEWYLSQDQATRDGLKGSIGRAGSALACPGLDARSETVAWLWDHHVAAVAADNHALESLPVDRTVGFMHYRLIPLLGFAVGELWWLEDVANAASAMGRYTFLFTSGVLNVPGGVGSPTNAYAVF